MEAVLRFYFDEQKAIQHIPTLQMLTVDPRVLKKKAKRLAGRLKKTLGPDCLVSLRQTESRVGGGALPEEPLPSWAVALQPVTISLGQMEERLRQSRTPIIGRIDQNAFLLDMRTVADAEIVQLAEMVQQLFGAS